MKRVKVELLRGLLEEVLDEMGKLKRLNSGVVNDRRWVREWNMVCDLRKMLDDKLKGRRA